MINNLFNKKSEDWFFCQLSSSQTPNCSEVKAIERNKEYVHIFLKSMRLVNVRKGLSKFYPAVHSNITVQHMRGTLAEFNVVTTPKHLGELDEKNLDRVISLNQRLLGPIPYRGGDLKIEVGLFSIKSADLAKPFLDLLSKISDLAGVSYISTAIPYIEPLKQGIDLLISSSSDSSLEIGLDKVFSPLETGFYVIMRAPKDEVRPSQLLLDAQDYKLSSLDTTSITEYPYIVLEIQSTKTRDDWYMIPEIAKAYNDLQNSFEAVNEANIKLNQQILKRVIFTSKDLTPNDANSITLSIDKEVLELLSVLKNNSEVFRGEEKINLKPLKDINVIF